MARGKRTRSIRDLRDEYDAAEQRRRDEEEVDDEDEDEDEDDDDLDEDDDIDEDVDDEDEEKPKKKKKAKVVKVAKPRAKRTRTVKVQRMKVVWGVFNNSHQRVATFEYKQKAEATKKAEELTASKSNNTHFVQPVKEPLEEKEKEKEK